MVIACPDLYGRQSACSVCLICGSVSDPRALRKATKKPTPSAEASGYTTRDFVPLLRAIIRFQVPWNRAHRTECSGAGSIGHVVSAP